MPSLLFSGSGNRVWTGGSRRFASRVLGVNLFVASLRFLRSPSLGSCWCVCVCVCVCVCLRERESERESVVSALVIGQAGWGLHVVAGWLGSVFCWIATCTSAMVL